MIKQIKSSFFAVFFALVFSTSSFSGEYYTSDAGGVSIGLQGHTMGFYGVGEEIPSNNAGNKDRKEAGAFSAEVFSVFAEYDAGPVSFGIGYIPETIASPENTNIQRDSSALDTDITNTAKVDINDIITVYALVDIPLGNSYVKLGWREATVETKESLGTGGSYNDVDVQGYSVALGYMFDTGSHGLSVRLEVEGAQYDDVEATNNADTSTKIKVSDLMSASGSISLVKTF